MDFVSSSRAAENRTRWKGIVANLSGMPRRSTKVMRYNRIELNRDALNHFGLYFTKDCS